MTPCQYMNATLFPFEAHDVCECIWSWLFDSLDSMQAKYLFPCHHHIILIWIVFYQSTDSGCRTLCHGVFLWWTNIKMFSKCWKSANNWKISMHCSININYSPNLLSQPLLNQTKTKFIDGLLLHVKIQQPKMQTNTKARSKPLHKTWITFHWSQRSCFDCSIA